MKKAAALLMAAVLTLGLLAGCSGKPSDGETGTKGADAPAGTPAEVTEPEASADTQYKKDIRIGTLADLTVACRYAGTATVTTQTCNSTFNGLVAVDANGEASPELALEWSSNDDASEWTFKLREGVKFHDGSDFTAEDVKFTWEYASTTENEGISQPITGVSMVDEVVVVDPYTVTFKLNTSSADWLYYAAQDILCKNAIETQGFDEGSKIGSGPYLFDSVESGVSWTIRRFEEYWGEKPVTESITFVVITDASSRALSLQSGDIDAMYDGNPSDLINFMSDEANYNVYKADNIQVVYAGFNALTEYGANKIVRQAVAMAVNREDIINACYENGSCGTIAYNFISTVGAGYTDVDSYEYDPEGAKKLLEDNNLSGITLKLYTFAKYIPVAEVLQSNLREVGITLEITEYAQTGFTKAIKEDNQYDLAINCTSQYGGILTVMVEYLMTNAARSFMNYSNADFDAKLTEALASASYEEMLAKYADLQQFVAEEVPGVALCMANLFCVGSSNFYGVNLNAQAVDVDFTGCYVIE
ncbi:MAG: ABC transporter substrate-binding protein [Lachnospiraceae bacterium]|nr:ABC transporter substrate-binding protein [Lachnospiraceae bacterium]